MKGRFYRISKGDKYQIHETVTEEYLRKSLADDHPGREEQVLLEMADGATYETCFCVYRWEPSAKMLEATLGPKAEALRAKWKAKIREADLRDDDALREESRVIWREYNRMLRREGFSYK